MHTLTFDWFLDVSHHPIICSINACLQEEKKVLISYYFLIIYEASVRVTNLELKKKIGVLSNTFVLSLSKKKNTSCNDLCLERNERIQVHNTPLMDYK